MKYYLIILGWMAFAFSVSSQHIEGIVYGRTPDGGQEALPGVNVYWADSDDGTVTDVHGAFHIHPHHPGQNKLVFSFVGYQNDTLDIEEDMEGLKVVLTVSRALEGVEVVERTATSFISRTDPISTRVITTGELQKAACCNLSESFETSASVDVSYSDAVSGAKQIKLLGLAGKYSLIQTENIPNLRGLGSIFGLGFIPGPWMQSIQVSKGAASVKNGFESTTGQINVEFKKPSSDEKLHLNLYANDAGKLESNANVRWKVNENWGSMLLWHSEHLGNKIDMNGDGFLDLPLVQQYNVMNRWSYEKPGKRHFEIGFSVLDERREAGQTAFYETESTLQDSLYQIMVNTRRYQVFSKNGFILRRPATSIGIIASATYHDQESIYGFNTFDATQTSLYLNSAYESYIWNTNQTIKLGASLQYDKYDETFRAVDMVREEVVPGLFSEFTFCGGEKFTLLAGLRADFHNLYGTFFTPRMHLKFAPREDFIVRASAGKGYRTPYVIAENPWILASSRNLITLEAPEMEEAWNYGINATRYIDVLGRELRISLDAYRTDFVNQLVVDLDRDPYAIYTYNLEGKSYANSIQLEAHYEVLRNLEMTAAIRYNDVKTTTDGRLQSKPLVNTYKALLSLSWQSPMKRWQGDLTAQFNGSSRLPSTEAYPEEYRRGDTGPAYTIILGQVTRNFKTWNVYLGVENLLDFVQKDPILAYDMPFSPYFDAASSWGPIHGRKIYLGLRYTLQ